jgi:DNA-binding transcriptional ArsR family regulator
MTRFGVMAHLDVLVEAGLVLVTRQGRHRLNHLNPVPVAQIYQRWMHPFAAAPANELLALKDSIERRPAMEDDTHRPSPSRSRHRSPSTPTWPPSGGR